MRISRESTQVIQNYSILKSNVKLFLYTAPYFSIPTMGVGSPELFLKNLFKQKTLKLFEKKLEL